jgi:hypothetical protein
MEVPSMSKAVKIILLLCSLLFFVSLTNATPQSHHSSGTHSSKSNSSKSKKSKGDKTVHVKGYYRKDGTYVAPYDRSAPGSGSSKNSGTRSPSTHGGATNGTYKKNYIAEGYSAHSSVQRDKHGKIKRSSSAKAAFERQSPCPSTGKTSGSCKGYVVDHINPLECGGADAPSNMQWQTVADGKAKDKTERSCRQ